MSNSLQLHELQHSRFPCPSLFSQSLLKLMSVELMMPSNYLILCGLLLLLPSVLPSIRVFSNELALHTKWPKYWASASASVLPTSIHNWFPLGLTGLIFLLYKRHSRVFSNTTVRMYQLFGTLPSLWSNSHSCMWLLERPQLWLYRPLSAKWCLCFLIYCLCLSWGFPSGASGKEPTCQCRRHKRCRCNPCARKIH